MLELLTTQANGPAGRWTHESLDYPVCPRSPRNFILYGGFCHKGGLPCENISINSQFLFWLCARLLACRRLRLRNPPPRRSPWPLLRRNREPSTHSIV